MISSPTERNQAVSCVFYIAWSFDSDLDTIQGRFTPMRLLQNKHCFSVALFSCVCLS